MVLPLLGMGQIHRAYTRPEPITEFHLKGGWQYNTLAGSGYTASYNSGWLAGIGFKIPLKYRWWLQTEILYSRRKTALQYPGSSAADAFTTSFTFNYINYPILLTFKPNDVLELQLGPQFGILLNNQSTNSNSQSTRTLSPSDVSKWDYAVAGGLELNVSPLAFGVRYAYGFVALATAEQAKEILGNGSLHGLQVYSALVF